MTWYYWVLIVAGLLAWCALPNLAAWLSKRPKLCKCRNCGSTKLHRYQDGGHDYVEACTECGARYGVQDDPFNLVERLPDLK